MLKKSTYNIIEKAVTRTTSLHKETPDDGAYCESRTKHQRKTKTMEDYLMFAVSGTYDNVV